MTIYKSVHSLQLPVGQFVVVGSAPLAALGLIDTATDIDLAVSEDVYAELKRRGWCEERGHGGKLVLRDDVFDAGVGLGPWTLEDLLSDAFYVDGVPFMNLEKVLQWKKAANRPKDQHHIELIERYLSAGA